MDDATGSLLDWRHLAEATPGGVAIQVEGQFVHVTDEFGEAVGADAESVVGESWRTPFESNQAGRLEREAIHAARSRGRWEGHIRVPGREGERLHLTLSETDGDVLVWTVQPSSKPGEGKKPAGNRGGRLEERPGFIWTLLDAVDDVIYVIGEDGHFHLWNETLVETTGYTHEEIADMEPMEFIPADQHEYVPGLRKAIEATEDRRVDVDILTKEGERITHEFRGTTFEDPGTGEQYRVGLARDVTDQRERERELERYETIVETVDDGVYELDEDLRFSFVNRAICDLFDSPREDLIGRPVTELFASDAERKMAEEIRRTAVESDSNRSTVTATVPTSSGERILESRYQLYPEPTDGEYRGSIGIIRDVTEREERTEELRRQRSLIQGILNTIPDIVFAFDEAGEPIVEEAMLDEFAGYSSEELAERSPFDLVPEEDRPTVMEQTHAVLAEGETVSYETDIVAKDGEAIPHEFRAAPLEMDGDVLGVVGSARDVTDRLERERALERQRDELATLDRMNELLLETTREVIQTASRDSVERAVCERLANSDLYEFAWVGEQEFDGERVVSGVSAGEDDDYLEAITITADDSDTGQGPAGCALRTGDVHVANVEDPSFKPWCEQAKERGFESVAAVPLQHGDTVYGVLVVYADREDAFTQREQAGFDMLGRSVGSVIHAARSRDLLFADAVVELEFRIEDDGLPFVRTAAAHDCELSLEGYVSSGDEWILYLDVIGEEPATIAEGLTNESRVKRVRTVRDGEDGGRLELVVTESSLLDTVTSAGATVRTATADATGVRLVVEAPREGDVRGVVDHVRNEYPESSLLANRERDRDVATVGRPGGILDELTDRQREVLETAYRAGYFAWPRESTAEEIATSLDLTAPTLHGHLRKAERTILSGLLADD